MTDTVREFSSRAIESQILGAGPETQLPLEVIVRGTGSGWTATRPPTAPGKHAEALGFSVRTLSELVTLVRQRWGDGVRLSGLEPLDLSAWPRRAS